MSPAWGPKKTGESLAASMELCSAEGVWTLPYSAQPALLYTLDSTLLGAPPSSYPPTAADPAVGPLLLSHSLSAPGIRGPGGL